MILISMQIDLYDEISLLQKLIQKQMIISENKLVICALGNSHYYISREKFEPELGFEPQISGFLTRPFELSWFSCHLMFKSPSWDILLKWHLSQEGDLNVSWHENQNSSSCRAPN